MQLASDILAALVRTEQEKPRNQQLTLGPSDMGGCREYIRNVLAGTPIQGNAEWPTAAVVGTLVGDYVEAACRTYLDAQTQKSITTMLPNGLIITGTADIIFPGRNALADCKTKDGLADVQRYGPSLENNVQVSIYTLGCVQNGYLEEGATAHLIYIDRAGNEQTIYEVVLTWEDIQGYIDICVDRLNDVLDAQEHVDAGDLEWARALRDKTPPFCYSEKVMCPFRDLCWEGSEWVPDEKIEDPAIIEVVARFVAARDDEKRAANVRAQARQALIGVTGITPDGYSVTWPGDGRALYVTKVRK